MDDVGGRDADCIRGTRYQQVGEIWWASPVSGFLAAYAMGLHDSTSTGYRRICLASAWVSVHQALNAAGGAIRLFFPIISPARTTRPSWEWTSPLVG